MWSTASAQDEREVFLFHRSLLHEVHRKQVTSICRIQMLQAFAEMNSIIPMIRNPDNVLRSIPELEPKTAVLVSFLLEMNPP